MRSAATAVSPGTSGLLVDALVFDMDGLLLDTERLALLALQQAGRELGLEMPDSLCRSMIGVAADTSRALFLECHGQAAPADPLFAAAARHLETSIDAGALRVKAGVTQLLDAAAHAALPRAVATSSSRRKALHHLQAAGIADRFDAVVTRDDVTRGKPHPDLFLHAAARMASHPIDCVVIEDSVHGVTAGVAAGMRVIGFTGGGHCAADHGTGLIAAGAEIVCANMMEVSGRLAADGYLRTA
jgi:HAD superfamily hydrolase (TIGR01509 family)